MKAKMMKRIVAFLLCITLIFSILPVTVHAEGNDTGKPVDVPSMITAEWINPLYENQGDCPSVIDDAAPTSVDVTVYHTNPADVAAEIKEDVKARATQITFGYEFYPEQYTSEGLKQLLNGIKETAFAHTGVYNEGDYLQWSIGRLSLKVQFVEWGKNNETYLSKATLTIVYNDSAECEAEVAKAEAQLLNELKPSGTDYEKIKVIYDWMCENIYYDYDNLNDDTYRLKHSAYAALVQKTSVCQGYALLLYRLALKMGIDCRLIVGKGNGGNHAWNILKLDGVYYNVDATWDAAWKQAGLEYPYFLRNDANFGDHTRGEQYVTDEFYAAYPMSPVDYDAGHNFVSGVCDCGAVEISEITFPDANFRSYIMCQDYGADGVLTSEELSSVTSIMVISLGIKDLKGIEYFTALTTLYCVGNQLTNLDLSKNTMLTELHCDNNQLTSLDVSGCTALTKLYCYSNQLTNLDVSGCTALTRLDCSYNQLTSLDVSECTALTNLWCGHNQLTNLDVSECTALTELYCEENQLTSLDVSGCTALTYLSCYNNQMMSLDVSKNTRLTNLYCVGNKHTVSAVQNRFDLSNLAEEGFDISKASNWQGGTVSENILNATANEVTYTYDLGNGKTETFTLAIDGFCTHSWKDATCTEPKTCTRCGVIEGTADGDHIRDTYHKCTLCGHIGGSCGKNLTWELNEEGVLTISGTGDMEDNPWYTYAAQIKTVDIQPGVTSICEDAFSVCSSLTEIVIPKGVTRIGIGAFNYCVALRDVVFAEGVTCIETGAFSNCSSLKELNLPEGLIRIDGAAFLGCTGLTDVTFPNSLTEIGGEAFRGCTGLTSLVFPQGIAVISGYAFSGCTNLTYVVIPDSVQKMNILTFENCSNLTDVYFGGTAERWDYVYSDLPTDMNVHYNCVDPTDHWKAESKEATCKEQGYTREACSCGYIRNEVKSDTLSHSWMDATCDTAKTCSVCKTTEGSALGHAMDEWYVTEDATCSEVGRKFRNCTRSGCAYEEEKTIPASGHDYEASVKAPTCTDRGYTTYCCTYCGDCYFGDYKAAKGHDWTEGSCTEPKVCVTCGVTESETPGHDWQDATCTTPKTCATCGVTEGAALDHDWKSATCTDPKTCETCGKTSGKALGHSWKGATCTEPKTCKTCKETSGKALGHDLGDWEVTTKPTTSKDGKETRSCERKGCDYSESRSIGKKPGTPSVTVSNVASTGKIKLTWKKVDGAAKYKVYRATSKSGSYTLLKTVTGTSLTNSSVDAGKTYYYKVQAVSKTGVESAYSSVASRTCDLAQPKVTLSNVASSGKIKVSWEKVSGATKYEVYRATSKNGTYSKLTTVTGTSYTNTGASAGKTYYYKVKAIHSTSAANSAYSEIVSRTCDLARPDITVKLSSGNVKVSWAKISGATKYEIYRATTKDGTYKLVKTTTSASYTDKNVTSGKTYYYKVKAIHKTSSANSAYSSIDSIKVK